MVVVHAEVVRHLVYQRTADFGVQRVQRAFLAELVKTVRETPDGRGIGVVYWYPESILVDGLRVWNGG